MFYKIINTAPQFPPHFSEESCDVIMKLLNPVPSERLGSGDDGFIFIKKIPFSILIFSSFFKGANEIMTSPFFGTIDFDALLRHEIVPPFKPDVQNEQDTK